LLWATTAKIRPLTADLRLPLAASTNRRPEHPLVKIMPTPKIAPPTIAPE
jgi:hypothetical protein